MTSVVATGSETPLVEVRNEIARACAAVRRDPGGVTLVAISKMFGADAIAPVIAAGQRVFGENRVQEAKAKWPALTARHPGIELHLVGPLQSNKAKDAVALFDAIHSVDRPGLAEALAKECARLGRSTEWMASNSATASFALFDCNGPTRCSSMPGWRAVRSGHFALASCTRFSPNTR